MLPIPIPNAGRSLRRRRSSRKQASGSLLLVLIIASAVLAFIPVRVTLGYGSTKTTVIDGSLSGIHNLLTFIGLPDSVASLVFPKSTSQMAAEAGTIYDLDSLSIFVNSSILATLITTLAGNTPPWSGLAKVFSSMDFLSVKVLKTTIEFERTDQSATGLLSPFGQGPTFTGSSALIAQLRIILLSMTISGYKVGSTGTDVYHEITLSALNPLVSVTFDRVFLDLFVDPLASTAVYMVSADMTVYQGLALLLMTPSL
jgi:hypothetical protein